MELLWNHSFGKQESQDLVVCRPYAIVERYEELEAVDQGWLALDVKHMNREVFYQSRSTRVMLSEYKSAFKYHTLNSREIGMKEIHPQSLDDLKFTGLHSIYDSYIERKGFRDLYSPFINLFRRDTFVVYYYKDDPDVLIGFTKLKKYYHDDDSRFSHQMDMMFPEHSVHNPEGIFAMESVMHCNTAPISQLSLDMEIQFAEKNGASVFMMGSGYEASSQYKSKVKGFEWWTGEKWSKSKKAYCKLCRRDSELTQIKDLSAK